MNIRIFTWPTWRNEMRFRFEGSLVNERRSPEGDEVLRFCYFTVYIFQFADFGSSNRSTRGLIVQRNCWSSKKNLNLILLIFRILCVIRQICLLSGSGFTRDFQAFSMRISHSGLLGDRFLHDAFSLQHFSAWQASAEGHGLLLIELHRGFPGGESFEIRQSTGNLQPVYIKLTASHLRRSRTEICKLA